VGGGVWRKTIGNVVCACACMSRGLALTPLWLITPLRPRLHLQRASLSAQAKAHGSLIAHSLNICPARDSHAGHPPTSFSVRTGKGTWVPPRSFSQYLPCTCQTCMALANEFLYPQRQRHVGASSRDLSISALHVSDMHGTRQRAFLSAQAKARGCLLARPLHICRARVRVTQQLSEEGLWGSGA
jgi:hypothetical protein